MKIFIKSRKGLSLLSLAIALILFTIAIFFSAFMDAFFLKFHIVGTIRNEMQFTDVHDSLLAFISDMQFYRNFSFWFSQVKPIESLNCNLPYTCKITKLGDMKIDEDALIKRLNLIAGECFELNYSTKTIKGKKDCNLEVVAKSYIITLENIENLTLKK